MSKIIGNTMMTPVPRSDWNQTDATKVDYIKNKPEFGVLATQDEVGKDFLTTDVQTSLDKADNAENTYETKTDASSKLDEAKAYSDGTLESAKSYTDTKTADFVSATAVDNKINTHNTDTEAHNDVRLLIEGLTTRLNTLADSDDTTLDQMSEIVTYIKSNKDLIDGITTSKVSVLDIIDNLTTNVTDKPLSASQGVALKALIDAIPDWAKAKTKPTYTASEVGADPAGSASVVQTNLDTHTSNNSNPHGVTLSQLGVSATATELNYVDGVTSNIQAQLDSKTNKSDIATTAMQGTASGSDTYWKIANFGNWGTGNWTQKGFSMIITSRAGELVWVSLAANDSNTSAGAIRLINRYSKIKALYYSVSESAIYVNAAAWANNICAHIISNVNGDYVPTVANASALPADAVEINIVEVGINSTSAVVGNSSVKLEMGGSADRPTYNNADMALYSDITSLDTRLSTLEAAAVSVFSGTEAAMTVDVGEDGDIYLVTE